MAKTYQKIIFIFLTVFLIKGGFLYFLNNSEAKSKVFFDENGNSNIIHSFIQDGDQRFERIPLSKRGIQFEREKPKFQGYIIEFKEEPLITKWQEIKKKEGKLLSTPSLSPQFIEYRTNFISKFEFHKSFLRGVIPDFDNKIQREFKTVFSGISLNISEKEAEEIKKLNFVKGVHPNYEVKALLIESIPLINATSAWDGGFTGTSTIIAIIDTGIDYTHPALGSCTSTGPECKVIGGHDFVNDDSDPMDDHGHGTHCAGIAAGKYDDGDNIYEPARGEIWGVAPDAKLLAYKVLDRFGDGHTEDVISAIERAMDPNQDGVYSDQADIMSLSLGGWGDPDDPMSQAVDRAVEAGVVVVVAAGNSGPFYETITSPGSARKAITVGASDKSDKIAEFSSRGPVRWDNKALIKPDVVAPGVDIISAVPTGGCALCYDSGYLSLSGTSMATPHVAGAAALIKQKHPDWTPHQIKMALRNTGVDLVGYDVLTQGYGRLDVYESVKLTAAPPIAELADTFYEVSGIIDILGTATSSNFSGFKLYYGEGYNPLTWHEISSSTIPVVNGTLGFFDTSLVNDGEYLLKLEVKDTTSQTSQTSEDRRLILINNIELTYPLNNDIFRAGDRIEIKGTIQGTDFSNYTIEYGLGENPPEWFTTGIDNISQIIDATWDTSSITKAGFYTIRVTAYFQDGRQNQDFIKNIYLDPSLKEGWPKRIDWEYDQTWDFYWWAGMLEPVISDINLDGKKEIIVYVGGDPPKLFVYKEDGSLLWSANVGIDRVNGGNLHIPLVGDLNNDGFGEIIVYNFKLSDENQSELYVFKHDGSLLWSSAVPKDFHPTMLLADLNLDGNKEIVIKGNNVGQRKMVVISKDGIILSQWDLPTSTWFTDIESTPAVGNFDKDPELEIVSASPSENAGYDWENKTWINEGLIYVYNMDGSVVDGWPVTVPGQPFSSPAVGDINNDGDSEIVIGLVYASDFPNEKYGGLYAFDKKGNILHGWPFRKGDEFWSSPSLADFDEDGDLEIGASRLGFETYIIHYDGTLAVGWPRSTSWNDYYSTIIGDVNGDGKLDILTTAGSGIKAPGGVYAWNFNGNLIYGFPKITELDAQAPAVIADIDNDGDVELVASSNLDYDYTTEKFKHRSTIYVWELNQPYNRETMRWPMFHHDPQLTGNYKATALTANLLSVADDTTFPYYTNEPAPKILISGQPNMLCRWGNTDVVYSKMSSESSYQCSVDGFIATCYLPNQGEDGEKTVYISCKDDFDNEQSPYQNLNVTFTLDTKKPTVLSAIAPRDPVKAGEVTIMIIFNEEMNTGTIPVVKITNLKTSYPVTQSTYQSETWIGTFKLLDEDEERAATILVKEAKDLAGNMMNEAPRAGTFRIDTLAPDPPTVTDPSSPITVNADHYIIKGKAEASALINIYKGKHLVGSQQLIDRATDYSIKVNLVKDQANNFIITATDAFRNKSKGTVIPTITEDSTPPARPTINSVKTPTYDSTQMITGTKPAFTSVWLNQSKIIDLNDWTSWSYKISLSRGENPISITVKDLALNESEAATTSITREIPPGIGGGGIWRQIVPPPQISKIEVKVTSSTAIISWKTDKPATSIVNYGTTTAYGKTVSSEKLVTSHSLTLTGLTPSTTYHYQIQSTDRTGNTGTYADKTFTTLAGLVKEIIGEGTITPLKGGKITATSVEGSTASVDIPAEVVKVDTKVIITPVSTAKAKVGSPPTGSSLVGGYVYNFSAIAEGKVVTTFFQLVTLTFTYTDDQVAGLDESSLTINYWDEIAKKWVALETTVDPAKNTLICSITHFTYFTILGEQVVKEEKKEIIKEKPISEMTIEELRIKIAQIKALILQLQAQLQQLLKEQLISEIPAGFKFTNPLRLRDKNIEVKYLQIFLKAQGPDIYPQGLVTGYFGYLTLHAVKRFQLKYGIITPETSLRIAGYVGPGTRAKINEILGY